MLADCSNHLLSVSCPALLSPALLTVRRNQFLENSQSQNQSNSHNIGAFTARGTSRNEVLISFARAAAQNTAGNQLESTVSARDGSGCRTDFPDSAKYYKLAADRNDAKAQFNYGVCLQNGRGVEIDLIKAAKYYKLAADQNHANAQFNYGVCLENGEGVQIDLIQAAKYYKLAADQNDTHAQLKYALCHLERSSVKMDLIEAARYFRFAGSFTREPVVNRDEKLAEFGVPLNLVVAPAIYERSTLRRSFVLLDPLSRLLEFGHYPEKDIELAADFCFASAIDGSARPQANYGFCLEHGLRIDSILSRETHPHLSTFARSRQI
jgi:TPR repeat protein